MAGKKSRVLEEILDICIAKNDLVFHNNLVKDISQKQGWANPFDATKLDNTNKLPPKLHDLDYAVVHLGNGYHQFVRGIDKIYHKFEPIQQTIDWPYKKSLLNKINTSESNTFSIANNQRILHHFLFGKDTEFSNIDISKRPKTYFPHRTKSSFNYCVGKGFPLELSNIQIEIDLTIEYQGTIGVFEAKNSKPENFNIYQLFHPYLYYYNAQKHPELKDEIKDIICVYLVYKENKKDQNNGMFSLWAYTFDNPLDITSIRFVKSVCYNLVGKKG